MKHPRRSPSLLSFQKTQPIGKAHGTRPDQVQREVHLFALQTAQYGVDEVVEMYGLYLLCTATRQRQHGEAGQQAEKAQAAAALAVDERRPQHEPRQRQAAQVFIGGPLAQLVRRETLRVGAEGGKLHDARCTGLHTRIEQCRGGAVMQGVEALLPMLTDDTDCVDHGIDTTQVRYPVCRRLQTIEVVTQAAGQRPHFVSGLAQRRYQRATDESRGACQQYLVNFTHGLLLSLWRRLVPCRFADLRIDHSAIDRLQDDHLARWISRYFPGVIPRLSRKAA